jgi:MFS transporter, ACS family, D-galactonate transporter
MRASKSINVAQSEPWRAWVIVALLFFFQFINYADKSVLGLAKPGIMKDLHLTNTEFGDVGSSFFYLFAISSMIFGFTANRMQSRWLILGMGIAWAMTQFPMVGAASVGTLYACRIALGAAEGPGYPIALHATYKWFENTKRTLPTSLLVLGAGIGTAVAGQVLPLIIIHWDWHAAFLTVGLAGLVWSLAWLVLGREGSLHDEPASEASETGKRGLFRMIADGFALYGPILATRTAIGVFLVSFAAYWSIAVGLVWGFGYMVEAVGLTQPQSGQVVTAPTLLSIVLAPLIAYISQHLIQNGVSSRYSRGAFGCVGVILGGLGFAGMALTSKLFFPVAGFSISSSVVFFTFAASITYLIYTVGPPIIAEITPPRQRAAMLSIYNAFYSTAGILAPSVMGRVLDAAPGDVTTGYRNGYLLMALLLVAAGVVGLLLIDPARDVARLARARGRAEAEVPSFSPAE